MEISKSAGGNDYDVLRTDRLANIRDVKKTIRKCNKTTFIESNPQTKPF